MWPQVSPESAGRIQEKIEKVAEEKGYTHRRLREEEKERFGLKETHGAFKILEKVA